MDFDDKPPDSSTSTSSREELAEKAEAILNLRRARNEIFGDAGLFGEPAWDILLDLFLSEERSKLISISSACIASGVPSTTALRWIKVLEDRGLVFRQPDATDSRRTYLRLTYRGKSLLEDVLRK
jgi:DNA-binding MarR family transcriptional regulator